ncbi:hypothetical protein [Pedobacter rhizosphaerae]|uniref:Uncharacterized protein n=1 Tax=Pedobacter rhizosphaerae TaxID=390241 RepID=A0A1H9VEW0_9SPHI|nr:hypothetical protein [Pedobacter rhizosphaerae]SES20091.1 hypothetical protein SAMN04488023_1428 [Pedobacter rhizosphaerae]
MKLRIICALFLGLIFLRVEAQTAIAISVGGDADKFYPVTFSDPNWDLNKPTTISIGRSNVHEDQVWIGSVMADFTYHTSNWGHSSDFLDVNLYTAIGARFVIAGWARSYTMRNIIVWLKGGGLTYHINSPASVAVTVYDGVQNALPFQEISGPARTYLTAVQDYVNIYGLNHSGSAYFMGGGSNFINGNLGIGIQNPAEKLAVNGNIRAKEVRVEAANWPDYVFQPEYDLPTLSEIEKQIKANGHLPEMPSAKEVETNGVALGEMNKILLKKIEELTLHLIEKDKEMKQQTAAMMDLKKDVEALNHLIRK